MIRRPPRLPHPSSTTAVLTVALSAALLQGLYPSVVAPLFRLRRPHGPAGLCLDARSPEPSSSSEPEQVGPDSSSVVVVDPPPSCFLWPPPLQQEQEQQQESVPIVADPCRSFSEGYHEARDRFRRAVRSVPGAELVTLDVPVPGSSGGGDGGIGGDDDGAYTIDIAVIRGSDGDGDGGGGGLVVHSSGVHGVEGYAGSAVQVAFLRHLSLLSRLAGNKEPPPLLTKPTLILIHAFNPFGMAHYRRTNENNVDLNRNALHPDQFTRLLRDRDPNVAGYVDIDLTLFNPPRKPNWFDAYVRFYLQAAFSIGRFGFVPMKRAMVAAQYHNSRGIFYGGTELERSHKLVTDFLVGGGWTTAGTVTWVDVHTGLGPSGIDTLIAHGSGSDEEDDDGPEERWFPGAPRPVQHHFAKSASSDDDVTSGYDLSVGIMNDYYSALFFGEEEGTAAKSTEASPPPRQQRRGRRRRHPLVVTQEFGTVPAVMVARGMILENMAYNFGTPPEQGYWSTYSRDAFYVRTDMWRWQVLERGILVLCQAIVRSSQ